MKFTDHLVLLSVFLSIETIILHRLASNTTLVHKRTLHSYCNKQIRSHVTESEGEPNLSNSLYNICTKRVIDQQELLRAYQDLRRVFQRSHSSGSLITLQVVEVKALYTRAE